jgi:hypothetical protein
MQANRIKIKTAAANITMLLGFAKDSLIAYTSISVAAGSSSEAISPVSSFIRFIGL